MKVVRRQPRTVKCSTCGTFNEPLGDSNFDGTCWKCKAKLPDRCETCGGPAAFDTAKRCNSCWEVEHRLEEYLRSEKGRAFVREKLGDVP